MYNVHVHVQWKPSNQLINKSFVVAAMHTCAAFDPQNEDTFKVQGCPDEMSSTVHLYICIHVYIHTYILLLHMYMYIHVLMRDERRKKERSKQGVHIIIKYMCTYMYNV